MESRDFIELPVFEDAKNKTYSVLFRIFSAFDRAKMHENILKNQTDIPKYSSQSRSVVSGG